MEAVVFDANTLTLKYEPNYPIPRITNDTDVIVKVEYSGVCGTDLHIIQGEFPVTKEKLLTLGHEFSGIVHEVGNASVFKKGQKVVVDPNRACNLCSFCRDGCYQFCLSVGGKKTSIGTFQDGGWAQYAVVPQDQVYALPDEITTEQAGLCEPYSCVSHGFDRASPLPVGSKILIVGAGIIESVWGGTTSLSLIPPKSCVKILLCSRLKGNDARNLWITILHHQGHRNVTVSEINKDRLEIVKRVNTGYRLVTPHLLESEKQLYDVIIDCTGVGKVMEVSFNYLRHGGKYVLFGCCPPTNKATVNPFQIYEKELAVIGVKVNPFSFPKAIGWLKAMGDRYLDYENLGVKTFKLSEYQMALHEMKAGVISKAMFKFA